MELYSIPCITSPKLKYLTSICTFIQSLLTISNYFVQGVVQAGVVTSLRFAVCGAGLLGLRVEGRSLRVQIVL